MTPRFKSAGWSSTWTSSTGTKTTSTRSRSLGGDSRLRGYPSGSFVGKDFVAANLEFRSRPFELLSVQFAGALFFDAGDAFNDFSKSA